MPKIIASQTNFNSGEVDPLLWGRIDSDRYKAGLVNATNCVVVSQGPVKRRNGSQFIGFAKNNADICRLLPFRSSASDSFVIELGNLYMRFYTNKAQVVDGGAYEIASPYTLADIPALQYAQHGDSIDFFHRDYAPRTLTRFGTASWVLTASTFNPPPTTELGDKPTTTLTPGTGSGTLDTSVTFVAGTAMFTLADVGRQLIHLGTNGKPDGGGIALISSVDTGSTPTTPTVTAVVKEAWVPSVTIASGRWVIDSSPSSSITPSGTAVGASITLTAGIRTWHTASEMSDVGKYVYLHNGVVKLTSLDAACLVATGTILKALDSSSATIAWTLESEVWTAALGYPGAGCYHEQRKWLGGTDEFPEKYWGSESGLYDKFGASADDDGSISAELPAGNSNGIVWMGSSRELIIGTKTSESSVFSSGAALTPADNNAKVRSNYGSALGPPLYVNNELVFVQKSYRKLKTYSYDYSIDGYSTDDLLFTAQHLVDGDIVEMAYSQDPDYIIYAIVDTGKLLAITFYRQAKMLGITHFETLGEYESVTTIPYGNSDQVWVSVKRTINGTTKRYIEVFDNGDGSAVLDGFSDSYLTYSDPKTVVAVTKANPGVVTCIAHGFSNGDYIRFKNMVGMTELDEHTYRIGSVTANTFTILTKALANVDTATYGTFITGNVYRLVSQITGLAHLEGETVQIKADGAKAPDAVVTAGSVTVAARCAEATVGLPYETFIKTLPKDYVLTGGTMQGQTTRWVAPILRVLNSTIPELSGTFLPAREGDDLMDTPVPLFTGDLIYGPTDWDTTGQLELTISDPYPFTLLAIFGTVEGNVK